MVIPTILLSFLFKLILILIYSFCLNQGDTHADNKSQDFLEAIVLYEEAISSAGRFGFQQYEAKGTLLFLSLSLLPLTFLHFLSFLCITSHISH